MYKEQQTGGLGGGGQKKAEVYRIMEQINGSPNDKYFPRTLVEVSGLELLKLDTNP